MVRSVFARCCVGAGLPLGFGLIMSFLMLMGCQSPEAPTVYAISSGQFLKDYSKLESISPKSWRYVNPDYNMGDYERFIVDRVTLLLDDKTRKNVGSWDDLEGLRFYMRDAMIKALNGPYTVWQGAAGPGTARIRMALTDVKEGSALSPISGGASIEVEVLDSATGDQIWVLVEERQAKRVVGGEISRWNDAHVVMTYWGEQLYRRMKEAHAL